MARVKKLKPTQYEVRDYADPSAVDYDTFLTTDSSREAKAAVKSFAAEANAPAVRVAVHVSVIASSQK